MHTAGKNTFTLGSIGFIGAAGQNVAGAALNTRNTDGYTVDGEQITRIRVSADDSVQGDTFRGN